jgi:competence protein ComEA
MASAFDPFKKADDLKHVKGIGKATIERNRSAIQLAAGDAADVVAEAPAKPARKNKKAAHEE